MEPADVNMEPADVINMEPADIKMKIAKDNDVGSDLLPSLKTMPFHKQVQIMRDWHPNLHDVDYYEILPTNVREWRHKIFSHSGIEQYRDFGGKFKHALAVSTFSPRCWELALTIFRRYEAGILFSGQKSTNVTQDLLKPCVGIKDESLLHEQLSEFAQGNLTKQAFHQHVLTLKLKLSQPAEHGIVKVETTPEEESILKQENKDLKDELQSANSRNEELQKEILVLQGQMQAMKDHGARLEEELESCKEEDEKRLKRTVYNFEEDLPKESEKKRFKKDSISKNAAKTAYQTEPGTVLVATYGDKLHFASILDSKEIQWCEYVLAVAEKKVNNIKSRYRLGKSVSEYWDHSMIKAVLPTQYAFINGVMVVEDKLSLKTIVNEAFEAFDG